MPTTGLHRFRMSALVKYAIVLASGVAIGVYVNGPGSFERVAKLARVDEINIRISNSFADTRPEAAAIVVDPTDARRVNEDLDYLIAKRTGTLHGWEAFLAAHGNGVRAGSAEAEIDKLSLLAKASEPVAVEVSELRSPQAKVESEGARPSPPSEAATFPHHEDCVDDRDCPGGSRIDRSNAESTIFASDLQSEEIRPQLASFVDGLVGAPLPPDSAAKVAPDLGAKPRAPTIRHVPTVSAPVVSGQHQRSCANNFQCRLKTRTLPPIILAILGVKMKHPTRAFRQTLADARLGDLRGR